MKLIKANQKSTLILNAAWMPQSFTTAKNAMRVLLVGGAVALDKNYMQHDFESWIGDFHYDQEFDGQPYIKGASKNYRVPTILLAKHVPPNSLKRKQKNPSLKQLYAMYDKVCQYCLQEIPFKNATREHVIPKSMGGTNDDFNIVLACRKCNAKKADVYPYLDINKEEVKAMTLQGSLYRLMTLGIKIRPEWESFLFKK